MFALFLSEKNRPAFLAGFSYCKTPGASSKGKSMTLERIWGLYTDTEPGLYIIGLATAFILTRMSCTQVLPRMYMQSPTALETPSAARIIAYKEIPLFMAHRSLFEFVNILVDPAFLQTLVESCPSEHQLTNDGLSSCVISAI